MIRSLPLLLLCSCIPQKSAEPEHHYKRPTGDTPLVMTNATRYPICNIEMSLDTSKDPDMLMLMPLATDGGAGPSKELAPGASLKLGVMTGTYSVRMGSCNKVLYGGHDVVVDGPLALGLGGPETTAPPSYRHSVFDMKVPGSSPSHSSGGGACKPAGDTSALDGRECCSGSVTSYSAKHPGPSHCSYPDEL